MSASLSLQTQCASTPITNNAPPPTPAATPSANQLLAISYLEIQAAFLSQRVAWLEEQLHISSHDHHRAVCPQWLMKNNHTAEDHNAISASPSGDEHDYGELMEVYINADVS